MPIDASELKEIFGDLVAEIRRIPMNTASTSAEMTAVKIQMAEFLTEIKHISHDVKGLTMKMDAQAGLFVPRKEIESTNAAFDGRVKRIEENMSKAAWAIIGAWFAGLVTVATVAKKLFM